MKKGLFLMVLLSAGLSTGLVHANAPDQGDGEPAGIVRLESIFRDRTIDQNTGAELVNEKIFSEQVYRIRFRDGESQVTGPATSLAFGSTSVDYIDFASDSDEVFFRRSAETSHLLASAAKMKLERSSHEYIIFINFHDSLGQNASRAWIKDLTTHQEMSLLKFAKAARSEFGL